MNKRFQSAMNDDVTVDHKASSAMLRGWFVSDDSLNNFQTKTLYRSTSINRLRFRAQLGFTFPTDKYFYGKMFSILRNKYKQSIDTTICLWYHKIYTVIDLWSTAPPTVIKTFIHIKSERIFRWLESFQSRRNVSTRLLSITSRHWQVNTYNLMIYFAAYHYADIRRNLVQVCELHSTIPSSLNSDLSVCDCQHLVKFVCAIVKFPWHDIEEGEEAREDV